MKEPRTPKKEAPAAPKKIGRPSKFTPKIADEICERLAKGEPLTWICRDEKMPHPSNVRIWMRSNEVFSLSIARAREDGFDVIAGQCLSIADTPMTGIKTVSKVTGTEITEGDMIEHRRLQVDTRLKLLSKWDPKRYGDKIQAEVNHDGAVEG